jgi:hypothetical protein
MDVKPSFLNMEQDCETRNRFSLDEFIGAINFDGNPLFLILVKQASFIDF